MLAGAKWIVANLGHRPDKDHQLHIMQKTLGFVPGNLMWVPTTQHKRMEFMTLILEENQKLKQENYALAQRLGELGYV